VTYFLSWFTSGSLRSRLQVSMYVQQLGCATLLVPKFDDRSVTI